MFCSGTSSEMHLESARNLRRNTNFLFGIAHVNRLPSAADSVVLLHGVRVLRLATPRDQFHPGGARDPVETRNGKGAKRRRHGN